MAHRSLAGRAEEETCGGGLLHSQQAEDAYCTPELLSPVEIVRAALCTASTNRGILSREILAVGPATLTAAANLFASRRTGALTHRAPKVASSSSSAYPLCWVFVRSSSSCA